MKKVLSILLTLAMVLGISSMAFAAEDFPFEDVPENSWYREAVEWAYSNDVLKGTSETTFSPKNNLKREHFAVLLWRLEGSPVYEIENGKFLDVPNNISYDVFNAVNWISSKGIMNGITETEFGVGLSIRRQDIVTTLYRYLFEFKNPNGVPEMQPIPEKYVDADEISEYAYDAMRWAINIGMINGRTETELDPKGYATRAEVVKIIWIIIV